MKQFLEVVMFVTLLGALLAPSQPVSAQSDGDALCAEALAADDGGATSFQGYEIVRALDQGGPRSQVVLGTEGDDVLDGGPGTDILCGFGGSDILSGGSANDILVGGPGADQLYGGSGGDTLYTDAGDTVVDVGSGGRANMVIVTAPEAPATVLTVMITEPNIENVCDIVFEVTNADPSLSYEVNVRIFSDFAGEDTLVSFPTPQANGYAQGSFENILNTGDQVLDGTLKAGAVVIATAGGDTCGA